MTSVSLMQFHILTKVVLSRLHQGQLDAKGVEAHFAAL